MKIAYIGLGSNLANPQKQLLDAVKRIDRHPEMELLQCSAFYQSKPLTLNFSDLNTSDLNASSLQPSTQPDYINAVAKITTMLSAEDLLDCLQAIENQQGRVREEKWGARTLDLDILLFEQSVYETERLNIPHPHMCQREFVVYPLYEIEPDLLIPKKGPLSTIIKSVSENGLIKLA